MRELSDRLAFHGLPASVPVPGTDREIPVSHDVVDFITYLAYPCQVPYKLTVEGMPTGKKNDQALVLTVGPQDAPRPYMTHAIYFDARGVWFGISASDPLSRNMGFVPLPRHGFTAADAAHLLAVQAETDTATFSWSAWHAQQNQWNSEETRTASAARLAHLVRLRVSEKIRVEALTHLASEHADEFGAHIEAAKVMRALNSDWFPDAAV